MGDVMNVPIEMAPAKTNKTSTVIASCTNVFNVFATCLHLHMMSTHYIKNV